MQGMGFSALATTSSGFAYALAKTDGEPTLEQKLFHCQQLCDATDIPVSADFENGFADSPDGVATNVTKLMATGVAGCSIEDWSRDGRSLYDFDLAVDRVHAARSALDSVDMPIQLTARAENLLRGVNDLDDTIRRLQAFEAAGADVLYAPGLTSLEDLRSVTTELNKPFNVLGVMIPGATLADFHDAGALRVSLGGALTHATLKPLIDAGKEMRESGSFHWLSGMANGSEIAGLLKT